MKLSSEKCSSSWLNALSLDGFNVCLTKAEFRDRFALKYGWEPSNLPQKCKCGERIFNHSREKPLLTKLLALLMKQDSIIKPIDYGNLGSVKFTLTCRFSIHVPKHAHENRSSLQKLSKLKEADIRAMNCNVLEVIETINF